MDADGGSAAWHLKAKNARACPYVVCSWNPNGKFAQPNYGPGHGDAFLVAPITAVEPAPTNAERYILRFAEFARVSVPDVWPGNQNPVTYASLSKLGIDLDSLAFEPVSQRTELLVPASSSPSSNGAPLPISAAKPRLAAYYGVPIEAIEIVIRG